MCKRNGESVDHLLHSEVACALWNAFFSHFGFPGLCLDKCLTCLLVGGLVAVLRVLLCGRWCLLASCDDNGGKKMTEVSKMARQNIDP
jgi:hypothetical protein